MMESLSMEMLAVDRLFRCKQVANDGNGKTDSLSDKSAMGPCLAYWRWWTLKPKRISEHKRIAARLKILSQVKFSNSKKALRNAAGRG